ncbi:hypothetical protein [Lactobacillus xylocopicola]|uniref:Uncharacterized protein n=1 Tax=Lactobacillus xylocopicola TaxID=2976676 RepID=A0ABN6SKF1_9LACO|nr:hypothetical protein [Lactobacillus xylocopicola]BDR59889.1 hypothetical protein KIM322_01500 [Lactobacillus xylocopicola]
MKLTKIKILTAVNGLLTLSSLIMLFFGLCNQVNEPHRLLNESQTFTLNGNSMMIMGAVVAFTVFGLAFFATWLRCGRVKAHLSHH